MSTKWLVVVLVFLTLGLTVAYFVDRSQITRLLIKTVQQVAPNDNTLPDEMVSVFDPTQTAPVFLIEEVSREKEELQLQVIWPKPGEGSIFQSKLVCDEGIFVGATIGAVKRVDLEEFYTLVESDTLDGFRLYGRCDDQSCRELVGKCTLLIKGD